MSRSPKFALAAVLTIALGIGANTTVFSLANAVLLKDLPFENPDRVAYVRSTGRMTYRDFQVFEERSRTLEVGAFSTSMVSLAGGDRVPEYVEAAYVSGNTFSILGRPPLIGRSFTRSDELAGAPPVAMLSFGLWQTRYGGSPEAIGASIRIDSRPYTIVGVMNPGEAFPFEARLWIPLTAGDSGQDIGLFGRLQQDATFETAQAELEAIGAALSAELPELQEPADAAGFSVQVMPFRSRDLDSDTRALLLALEGAVTFVLLIACVNVANMLSSRMVSRQRELSIRSALGASRWAIARRPIIESLTVSVLGGILGLGLAVAALRWFEGAASDLWVPYWMDFGMDYRVFVYFLLACGTAGVLAGVAPALRVGRANLVESLKDGAHGIVGGRRSLGLSSALVVAEIALTIVLLVGAGLMVRSFLNNARVDLGGIDPSSALVAGLVLPFPEYSGAQERNALVNRLLEGMGSVAGVEGVALASHAPATSSLNNPVRLFDRNIADAGGSWPRVSRLFVAPGYFGGLGLSLIRGRDFTTADGSPGAEAVIVDEFFARRYWPGEEPLGKRIQIGADLFGAGPPETGPWLEVVGVAPRIYQGGPESDSSPEALPTIYTPFLQGSTGRFDLILRTHQPSDSILAELRNQLGRLDPDIPLFHAQTLDEILRLRAWGYQVFGTLFGVFALIALTMSAIGLYAVTSYGVSQRLREIAVRVALGESRASVFRRVLGQGIMRVLAGSAIGVAAALVLSRILTRLLYGVSPSDPVTFTAVAVTMGAVGLAACLVPAVQALRIDPLVALREE